MKDDVNESAEMVALKTFFNNIQQRINLKSFKDRNLPNLEVTYIDPLMDSIIT
jgi:hypothetical protein